MYINVKVIDIKTSVFIYIYKNPWNVGASEHRSCLSENQMLPRWTLMKNFTHRLAASHVSADQCVFVVVLCVKLTDCLWTEADLVWFWSPGLWWTEAPVSRHQSSRWSLEHRVFLAEVVESCWGRRRNVLGPYWYFMSAVKLWHNMRELRTLNCMK